MKRIGTAQEVADVCLFLCSSKATFVQGSALVSSLLFSLLLALEEELEINSGANNSSRNVRRRKSRGGIKDEKG